MQDSVPNDGNKRTFTFYAITLYYLRILYLLIPAALCFIDKIRVFEVFIVAAEDRVERESVGGGLFRRWFCCVCTVWRHRRSGEKAEDVEWGNF